MFNFFKIAANTFRESVREPVFFLMLFCALVLIGHYPSAALFVFSEQLKLVVDSSMATGLVFGLVSGVLCASHTVAREMRNGTVLLLPSNPVYRWNFILGKIAGILVAVTLFTAVCNFAGVIAVYVATDQFRMDMGVYYLYLGLLAAGCLVGMLANFFRGSSFPEIASYALTLMVPCSPSRSRPSRSPISAARWFSSISRRSRWRLWRWCSPPGSTSWPISASARWSSFSGWSPAIFSSGKPVRMRSISCSDSSTR